MKILYIRRNLTTIDGGSLISKRNIHLFNEIYSKNNIIHVIIDHDSKWVTLKNILFHKPLGYNKRILSELRKHIKDNKIDCIFIDHSLLGGFSKILSTYNLPIVTFFHNVEVLYYQQKRQIESLLDQLMIYFAKTNELSAISYSNYIITLTQRDSRNLNLIYGRNADLILPSSMIDKFLKGESDISHETYHLFVGSNFFANIEGISWYIENVLPYTNHKLIIIGNGMDFLKKKYVLDNLEILGFVENLEPYYANADFIINPIFSGSGMKTKTIEALMYGKTIIGTDEAFVGIEQSLDTVAYICNSKNEFLNAIDKFYSKGIIKYNKSSRNMFLENYSIEKSKKIILDFCREII